MAALKRSLLLAGVAVGVALASNLALSAYEQTARPAQQQTAADAKQALRQQQDATTTLARQAPRTTENPSVSVPPGTPEPVPTGIILGGAPAPVPASTFISVSLWQGWVGGRLVVVYAGADRQDPLQGRVLAFSVSSDLRSGTPIASYDTAVRAGPLAIAAANGSQLSLAASDGTRFSFDVAAGQLVLQHVTVISFTGPTTGDYNDAAPLSATLRDATAGGPLPSRVLTFTLGSKSCTSTTDAAGSASCAITPLDPAGSYPLSVTFAGDAPALLPISYAGMFTLMPEEVDVRYTGPTDAANGTAITLSATLREDGTTPVQGRSIALAYGTQGCAATTDATGTATCQLTLSQMLGAVTASAIFASDGFYRTASASVQARVHADTRIAYAGPTTADYHDVVTLLGRLTDVTDGGVPVSGRSLTFSLGSQSCTGVSDATGVAACAITPTAARGTYTLTARFDADAAYNGSTTTSDFVVTPEETTLAYSGDTLVARGATVRLAGVLKEDDTTAIAGRTVRFAFGAQTCDAVTDDTGAAACTVVAAQPLGPVGVSATFDGDGYYRPSSASASGLEYDYSAGGAFVIGDQSALAAGPVTFWANDWAKANVLSGGVAPSAFKGFTNTSGVPSCGVAWPTAPANSSAPPVTVPTYMAVIVSSGVSQSGDLITGSTSAVVVVATDAGYEPNPGHVGTGRVVATICAR